MMNFSVDRLIAPSTHEHKPFALKKNIYEETRIRLLSKEYEHESTEISKDKDEKPQIVEDPDKLAIVPANASTEKSCSITKNDKQNPKEDSRHVETFVAVIAKAILSAPGKRMTLSSIYHYIASNYAHFNREKGPGWRNSVRHNLSSNDCFVKAGRAENGKGHYWMIHPKDLPEFSKGNFRRRRKPRRPRCHHAVMFNGGAENAFFYHTLAATNLQERSSSPMSFSIMDSSKLPLVGHYDRPQYLDMSRSGLTVPPSLLWSSEVASRTFPKFTSGASALSFHQLCACRSPGIPCYYHKY